MPVLTLDAPASEVIDPDFVTDIASPTVWRSGRAEIAFPAPFTGSTWRVSRIVIRGEGPSAPYARVMVGGNATDRSDAFLRDVIDGFGTRRYSDLVVEDSEHLRIVLDWASPNYTYAATIEYDELYDAAAG